MDVVLGVAVTGPRARLALVGSGARGADVIDESFVDLADRPIETLTETVVGTNRLLADENHRLLATRLCWSDLQRADRLRRALEDSGVQDVAVLSESQAATAFSGAGRSCRGRRFRPMTTRRSRWPVARPWRRGSPETRRAWPPRSGWPETRRRWPPRYRERTRPARWDPTWRTRWPAIPTCFRWSG